MKLATAMSKRKLPYISISYYISILIKSAVLSFVFIFALFPHFLMVIAAQPASDNYKLNEYGFGAGGTTGSESDNYSLFGIAGQVESGQSESDSYKTNGGLTFMMQANVPPAPTFTNPDDYYNKLHLVINTGNNPDDSLFAIAISTDNFVADTKYVQSDNTVSSTLGLEDWQDYTTWGGASGFNIINLNPGTTYTVKVAASQGAYTQSGFGPTAQAVTSNPTLVFDIDIASSDTETAPPFTVNIGSLTATSVITAPDKIWLDIESNGTSGALIYVYGTNGGLLSNSTAKTISSTSSNLAAISEGYGARYDTVAESAGGPMRAVTPYDGAAEVVGVLDSTKRLIFDSSDAPVADGRTSFLIKAKASAVTEAATDYTDTLTIIGTAAY